MKTLEDILDEATALLASGEKNSIERAAELLEGRITSFLFRQAKNKYGLSDQTAEEIAQDVIFNFVMSAAKIDTKPIILLLKLLRTRALNEIQKLRAGKRLGEILELNEEEWSLLVEPIPDNDIPIETRIDIENIFRRFSFEQPKHAQILDLIVDGLSYKEIAEILGIDSDHNRAINVVRSRLESSKKAAQVYFEGYSAEDIYNTRKLMKIAGEDDAKYSKQELDILHEIHTIANSALSTLHQVRIRIEDKKLEDPRLLFTLNGSR